MQTVFETHLPQQIHGAATRLRLTAQFQRNHDVFERRQRWNQLKGLENKSHVLVANVRQTVFAQ